MLLCRPDFVVIFLSRIAAEGDTYVFKQNTMFDMLKLRLVAVFVCIHAQYGFLRPPWVPSRQARTFSKPRVT